MEQRKSMDWLISEPDLLEDHVVASVRHATQRHCLTVAFNTTYYECYL